MCTLSVRMDDKVIARVKPLFGGDKAMNKWIETVLHKAMEEYAEQYEQMAGKNALAETLTKRLKELEGDPEALYKMSGILGKPQAGFSWEELREEAIYDKYGGWRGNRFLVTCNKNTLRVEIEQNWSHN